MSPTAEFDQFADSYDDDLANSLSVSGESGGYFAEQRVRFVAGHLRRLGIKPHRVVDFGCGTGSTTPILANALPDAQITGVDISSKLIDAARSRYSNDRVQFSTLGDYRAQGEADLVYCNGVFHHIPLADRAQALDILRAALRPGGLVALWENNPWNLGTRYIMSRCVFDRNAESISPPAANKLLAGAGFDPSQTHFHFFFPRWLGWFRPSESLMTRIPFGAQYVVFATKPR